MTTSKTSQEFPLVGVGASAGGLESFKRLLGAIPKDSGMAYILVQHLSPSHESTLPEILSRSTDIPVQEITDDCQLKPDHIYVIPENKLLEVTDHSLKLSPRKEQEQHMPIDMFFSSMAQVHGPMAIGIVLSGTARDGTIGLRDIREHGGLTFVESPDSAAWTGMPQNAIEAGVVDFILRPEEIPAKLG
ncbi:MAG: chemotaxis protein CheB [Pricia sp.]